MTTINAVLRIAVVPLCLIASMMTAHGQQIVSAGEVNVVQGPVQATLSSHTLQIKDGKEVFIDDPRQVRPGDVIEYRVTYLNFSEQTVSDVQATLPIPIGANYLAGSARPALVMARTMNGTTTVLSDFVPVPIKRQVVVAGKSQAVDVPESEYRELRWNLAELKKGESKTVKARIVVPRGYAQDSVSGATKAAKTVNAPKTSDVAKAIKAVEPAMVTKSSTYESAK
ncbi:DUF11 domain-containing protein [Glaciimonas immobilis]|uniref:Putative repeat protein (TIGR01451 family) n=1 Tax=Glaciimonas immobilis TaxID=728004 RepID=A0A840RSK9_9BURK|nr:DUF11 domain-containing protein [Glaciimonas immobilis]KAF3997088.1 DUF11 domain-containing protein [Glaciimonas immobilis]MBB5199946.1 putative repeat protein (TIGR01451 family) [Glaciimonas immobilis]